MLCLSYSNVWRIDCFVVVCKFGTRFPNKNMQSLGTSKQRSSNNTITTSTTSDKEEIIAGGFNIARKRKFLDWY